MKLSLTIVLIALSISFAICEDNNNSPSVESNDAVVKSSVTKKPTKEEKKKVDSETKEQLEESTNDDKELKKQEKEAKAKDSDETENVTESDAQDSDEGSAEESIDNENEADNDDAGEEDEATIKRAEESKADKGGKKGKKFMAYPLFYPGDYFGGREYGHHTGGPAGFHPGSIWEYPYPFVHPMYPSPFYPCQCKCKDDKEKEQDKKEKNKKTRRKQLVPSHYYGPPSAGWGAYQPGHTGAGWGAPYWYKSYIPSTQPIPQQAKTEDANTRHTINDGLDFGIAHSHDTAQVSYGSHDDASYGLGDTFGAGWHDGYTDHPVYGTYGGGPGRTTYVDPVYGDLENAGLNGWGSGVGRPYLPHGGHGYDDFDEGHGDIGNGYGGHDYSGHGYGGHGYGGHGYGGHGYGDHGNGGHHGYSEAVGHPYVPSHEGLSHGPVHHGETFFGPHTAMLPTAQGHIQVASAGHAVGMGGHNLGGFADKMNPGHGTEGDFVAGIHADLDSHEVAGHHHDHAAAGHLNAPLLHTGSDHGFGELGDHFGSLPEHHEGHAYMGMADHFGPIEEIDGGHGGHLGGHSGLQGGRDTLHGHHGSHHGLNHRIYHDFGAHAGHGGAFDGHIGDSISGSHLFGGVHKSGVPVKHKASKKIKPKARQHVKKTKHQ